MQDRKLKTRFPLSLLQPIWNHGQRTQASSTCGEDGISYRRRDAGDGRFTCAGGGEVFAIYQDNFSPWQVIETGHAIFGEVRVFDPAVFELNGFEQCATEAHDGGAFD